MKPKFYLMKIKVSRSHTMLRRNVKYEARWNNSSKEGYQKQANDETLRNIREKWTCKGGSFIMRT